ncbi:uncharacterized protein FFB20_15466 [Fusarium fujikuroi]|nr:uncharacterized protein FFE2_03634 [Fusarium fujikuroi]SCN78861.1 uncharacterized protein FFM5_01967 [Fusarium fujikuroi]SCN95080.1 uncharacterized protein FFC1_07214 [Fusarium fujikuroi]SCO18320.1 uncharacterized protein FFB20_15466 [Fusarium fujikuroi]SCO33507.1 uncharacterized protein FFMR_03123 [Fusarium fujikuroi]
MATSATKIRIEDIPVVRPVVETMADPL